MIPASADPVEKLSLHHETIDERLRKTPRTARRMIQPELAHASSAGPTRTSDPIVLSTRCLSVWYGSSLAIKEITIEIPRNKITALIGPSGCGKSTLLTLFQSDERPHQRCADGGRGPV